MKQMEYVVTAQEMKAYDKRTIEYHKLDGLVLMERAALGMAEEIKRRKKQPCSVLVLAGIGNNGGDGLAAGRMLMLDGYDVTFYLAGVGGTDDAAAVEEKCSISCKRQLEILRSYGVTVKTDSTAAGIFRTKEYDIIIDALFGVGLSRALTGEYAKLAEQVNQTDAFVAACDIPSGICADTGQVLGCAVKADLTVTFAWKKRGLLLYPGAEYAGEVCCVQMGITEHAFRETAADGKAFKEKKPEAFTYGNEDLCLLPKRSADGNKGTFGKVLLIAGSVNMAGAACLAAKSCYRSGAGLVRVFTQEENRVILQTVVPEAVLHTDRSLLKEDIEWADCIVAGPGIGMSERAADVLQELLSTETKEAKICLLDADALNLLAKEEGLMQTFAKQAAKWQMILTPHIAELSRLTGVETKKLKEDIIKCGREFTDAYPVTLVCKDARTVVIHSAAEAVETEKVKEPHIYINTSGNDALATAGAGDVLAGIIAGLAAQGTDSFSAAALGVYIHGLAGERAAEGSSRYSVMAGDLPEALGKVLGGIVRGKESETVRNTGDGK